MYLAQLLLVGILSGAVLSLVGVGFTLVLGVGKIANFAHGALVGVGMYAGYSAAKYADINPYLLLIPAALVFAVVGWAVAEMFEWRGRKIGHIGELVVGLALLLLINGALEVVFGADARTYSSVDIGSVKAFGLIIPATQIIAASFTFVVAFVAYLFIQQTRWGRALRAVAENPNAAALHGIRVPIAQRVAVVASIVLAGLSGIIIAPFSVMTPDVGAGYLISAFAVVIVGGVGNTLGAVAAGLGIGVINSLAAGYLSSVWTTLTPLLLLLLFLLVRPVKVQA